MSKRVDVVLTKEDIEALEWARFLMDTKDWMPRQRHDPEVAEHVRKCDAALRALAKIIGGAN